MKMVRNVAVALALIASAAAAKADSVAWFSTAAPVAPAGGGPGAPGTRLDLTCDTSGPAGSCSWVITFSVNSTGNKLGGWTAELGTAAGNGVSVSNSAIAGGNPFGSNAAAGVGGTGNALLTGAGGFTLTPPAAPSSINLITFTLSRSYATGNLSVADIFFRTPASDSVVWTNGDVGDYEVVAVGPNAPQQGTENNNSFGLPVIRITNVPEPTTLALLALGGIAALRRRTAR